MTELQLIIIQKKKDGYLTAARSMVCKKAWSLYFITKTERLQLQAVVEQTEIDHAIIKINGEADTRTFYSADINRLATNTIRLSLDLKDAAAERRVTELLNAINSISSGKIEFV